MQVALALQRLHHGTTFETRDLCEVQNRAERRKAVGGPHSDLNFLLLEAAYI